jgi:histidinol-phosphate/aromatic aminotransferase/cobyric acid decarboxylase-like protein
MLSIKDIRIQGKSEWTCNGKHPGFSRGNLLPDEPDPGLSGVVRLDQNENNLNASETVLKAARDACADSARYPPESHASALYETIADQHTLSVNQIVCGRGSMDLISLLTNTYLDSHSSAVVSQYGYMYFTTAIAQAGARITSAPEPDLVVNPDAIVLCITNDTRMVLIANPGNPTGSYLPKKEIRQLRESLSSDILLVIDEAYAEYLDQSTSTDNFDLVGRGDTVVLRTFSKIYGLAGLRIGWGYFPPRNCYGVENNSTTRRVDRPESGGRHCSYAR